MILLLETATDRCSVALWDGLSILDTAVAEATFSHASQLTPLIDKLMQRQQLDFAALRAVAVSYGPGSYTGLRIGLSTAKGICFATDCSLIVIDTLQALAAGGRALYPDADYIVPMIDARRMEVYTAAYDAQGDAVLPTQAMIVAEGAFAEWLDTGKRLAFVGNGAMKCAPIIGADRATFVELDCDASYLAGLAQAAFDAQAFADVAYVEPAYLKSPNITKPKSKLAL